ncbi:hypothetical protein [Stenotrophomonas sp. GZD-301]
MLKANLCSLDDIHEVERNAAVEDGRVSTLGGTSDREGVVATGLVATAIV